MRSRWLIAAAVLFAGGFILFTVAAQFTSGGGALITLMATPAAAAGCQTAPAAVGDVPAVGQLKPEQAKYAAIIISVGRSMGVPERGWVIAIAVALQESTLANVDHGDDWYWGAGGSPSRGLFQQIPAYYPGVDVMDPAQAARAFYERLQAPTDYRGQPKAPWEGRPLAQVAQEVQGSAFPAEYAKHEAVAQQAVQDLAGVTVAAPAATCLPVRASAGDWALPLPADRVPARAAEHHASAPGRSIPAVDVPLNAGETQPVFAMAAGTATAMDEFTVDPDGPGGCGHGVYVRGATGEWLYCHLSQQLVQSGQQVGPGDQIGVSGWSGGVRPVGPGGAHLHVQLRYGGRLTCVQPVFDALKAGQAPPAVGDLPQPPTNTCLAEWRRVRGG